MATESETQLTASDAREQISDLLGRVEYGGERFVITRNGRPAAAVVSLADLERLRSLARSRLGDAVSALRKHARAKGLDRLSDAAIESEIAATRTRPKPTKKKRRT